MLAREFDRNINDMVTRNMMYMVLIRLIQLNILLDIYTRYEIRGVKKYDVHGVNTLNSIENFTRHIYETFTRDMRYKVIIRGVKKRNSIEKFHIVNNNRYDLKIFQVINNQFNSALLTREIRFINLPCVITDFMNYGLLRCNILLTN